MTKSKKEIVVIDTKGFKKKLDAIRIIAIKTKGFRKKFNALKIILFRKGIILCPKEILFTKTLSKAITKAWKENNKT